MTDLITNLVTQGYSIYEAVKSGVPQALTKRGGAPLGEGPATVAATDQHSAG